MEIANLTQKIVEKKNFEVSLTISTKEFYGKLIEVYQIGGIPK